MSSCCGNELIYNSVLSEVLASNLENISYLIDILIKFWPLIGFVCFTATAISIYYFKPTGGHSDNFSDTQRK